MVLRALFASVSLVCLAGSPALAQETKAEVIHWWTSGGESAAVRVFADEFKKAGGTWQDSAVAGGANARTAAINRTVGGNPPTAMQFNTGKQFDDLVENNLLADIEAIAAEGKWKSAIPEPILNAVTRNGKIYAVPVNIHGQNWMFYSKPVLEKAGATEPKTWDEAIAVMEKVKAAGLIPLAFPGQKTWERNLFNAVLAGKGGPALWVGIHGKRDLKMAQSPEFKGVAETFKKLKDYIDPGAPGRNWNDAAALVIQGKAAMHVNGDWAKGEFVAAGQTADKDYGCVVLASGAQGYVMGGDVFAFPKPKDAATAKAQALLGKVMLDPVTQIEFAKKKGSIPVRQDVDVSSLDACAQKAVKAVANKDAQLPSQELLSPPAQTGAMEDAISQYWNTNMTADQFVEKVVGVLKQQY